MAKRKGHRRLRVSKYILLSCQVDPLVERIYGPLSSLSTGRFGLLEMPCSTLALGVGQRAALKPESQTGLTVLMGSCQADLLLPPGRADEAQGGSMAEKVLARLGLGNSCGEVTFMDSDRKAGQTRQGKSSSLQLLVQGPQIGYLESCANGVENSPSR